MSGFQSNVFIELGFDVPGEIFQDVPWTILGYTLESSGTPNVIGATAYTVTSQGFAQAGSGGTLGFAGILAINKSYTLKGLDGHALEASLVLADGTQAELITSGMVAVTLPDAANIGDYIIYNNTTGTLSSMAPGAIIPEGYSSAFATVSQFTQTISGEALAVVLMVPSIAGSSASSSWPYVNTFWVASNGEDTNSGASINAPLATIEAALALFVSGQNNVINIADAAAYSVPQGFGFGIAGFMTLNAPFATLNYNGGSGGIMFYQTIADGSLTVNCAFLNGGVCEYIFYNSGNASTTIANIGNLAQSPVIFSDQVTGGGSTAAAILNLGTTDTTGGDFTFGNACISVIDVKESLGQSLITNNNSAFNTRISAGFYNGTLAGNGYYLNIGSIGSSFNVTATGEIDGLTSGAYAGAPSANLMLNGLNMNQNSIYNAVFHTVYTAAPTGSWSYEPGLASGGQVIAIPSNASSGAILLPAASDFPEGWTIYFAQTVGSGAPISITSPDTIVGQNGISAGSCYTAAGFGQITRGQANGGGGFSWCADNCFTTN